MGKNKKQNFITNAELSYSQNFITSAKLLHRIVALSGIGKNDTVWEIGAGKGHLTRALCEKCGFLYAVEIDEKLFAKTKEKLAECRNLKMICGDFLELTLPAKGNYKVCANIPFFLTTKILDKLTSAVNPPTDIWLVMEKGAAKRFMGRHGETKKSLLLKVNWDMEIAYYFRKEDFHPAPSVDSVLFHLSRKAVPDLGRRDFISYRKFIEHSLQYGVCGKNGFLTRKQASAALKAAKLPPLTADGVTLYIQWLCLFRYWRNLNR